MPFARGGFPENYPLGPRMRDICPGGKLFFELDHWPHACSWPPDPVPMYARALGSCLVYIQNIVSQASRPDLCTPALAQLCVHPVGSSNWKGAAPLLVQGPMAKIILELGWQVPLQVHGLG